METPAWWLDVSNLMSGLVGALLGLAWPALHGWRRRRTERKGELQAMSAELRLARERLIGLRVVGIAAPLYHLPITVFGQATPKLIGEGLLAEQEITTLVEYLARSEELNRGLERARAAHAAGGDINVEFGRNCEKAKSMLATERAEYGGQALVPAVEALIERLLK